jgi:hypothetical protein
MALQRASTSGLVNSLPIITSSRLAGANVSNSSCLTVSRQNSVALTDLHKTAKDLTGSNAEIQQSLLEMLTGRHANRALVSFVWDD